MTTARRYLLRCALLLATQLIGLTNAWADCQVVAGAPASFGEVTSILVRTTAQDSSTTSSGLSCSAAILEVLGTDYIRATISSPNNSHMMGPTGDSIGFQIFADSGHTIALTPGTVYDYTSGTLINLLGIFGTPGATLPMYFRTVTGSNVAAGTYTETLTIHWEWDYCPSIGLLGVCLTPRSVGTGDATVPVTLTVTNDCTFVAPDINFGSAPIASGFPSVAGNISLTCTKGMTYTVGLGSGLHVAGNGRRQMASGAERLQYDIFSSGAVVWGTTLNRVSSAGAADGLTAQLFPYTASVYKDQATPPIGIYTDSVVVDVRY